MPSSLKSEDSAHSLIPPTPESDMTNSPRSSTTKLDTSEMTHDKTPTNPPQKRKAGRKPVYKTAQERRDRNRKAQLDFRARRTAYMARLEESYRSLEKVVVELQVSNRAANDALARAHDALNNERAKVKYLERMMQSPSPFSAPQQVRVPAYTSTNTMSLSAEQCTATAGHMQGVSFPHHSLITLEQQISPSTESMNHLFSPENFLDPSPGYSPHTTHHAFAQTPQPDELTGVEYNNSTSSTSVYHPWPEDAQNNMATSTTTTTATTTA